MDEYYYEDDHEDHIWESVECDYDDDCEDDDDDNHENAASNYESWREDFHSDVGITPNDYEPYYD